MLLEIEQNENAMKDDFLEWPADSICLNPESLELTALAREVYRRTCRTDFREPGFCVVNLGPALDSHAFRRIMVDLKQEMAAIHETDAGKSFHYLSLGRFDQQTSTKPHLDSGPEECFLMLGYEPSEVASALEISDYSKCAFEMGLTPQEFLAKHNPMFQSGYEMLRPYTTRVPCFSETDYQIVCINNSFAPFSMEKPVWQGTLHTATVRTPDESKRRVINSTLIASVPIGADAVVSKSDEQEFVKTTLVRRRDYGTLQQEDDF